MKRAYHDHPPIRPDGLDGRLGKLHAAAAQSHRRQAAAWELRRLRLRRERVLQLLRTPLVGPVLDSERPLASELDLADQALDTLAVEVAA